MQGVGHTRQAAWVGEECGVVIIYAAVTSRGTHPKDGSNNAADGLFQQPDRERKGNPARVRGKAAALKAVLSQAVADTIRMTTVRIISLLASIGFMFSVMTFIGGFRAVRRTDQPAEVLMHRVNGYCTVMFYLIVASMSMALGSRPLYVAAWLSGLLFHAFKVLIVRAGFGVKYGGYLGSILLIIWLIIIFTHLPS